MLTRKAIPVGFALIGALLVPLPATADRATPAATPLKNRAPIKAARQKPAAVAKRIDRSTAKAVPPATVLARPRTVVAHFAGDPSDTISDFVFTPSTLTVHVGDTVTWTNNGPTAHTATANDGSFDTGTLQKGQSASHTFSRAGTFAYVCSIHPFMHGTVVVLGNGSGASGSSGSSSGSGASRSSSGTSTGSSSGGATTSSGTSAGSTGNSSGGSLPNTGSNLLATILTGALLASAGMLLRRRLEVRAGRD